MALRFSVVIPTFNRKEALCRCLESLARQTLDASEYEVIVVDDGSTDGTRAAIKAFTWPFECKTFSQRNAGPSSARNFGVTQSRGEIIAFTEDDVEVHPDWLKNAQTYFVGSSVALLEGRTIYASTGKSIRRFESHGVHSFVPGNLFVRKEIFSKVGGYDPMFFDPERGLYFREDADLGFRILDLGAQTGIASDVVVEHPLQFTGLPACFRHSRRYVFDPLLHRKHPVRFRQMIEVKSFLGITIHRPQHYVAVAYLLSLAAFVLLLTEKAGGSVVVPAIVMVVCSFLFRYKYQGVAALKIYRVGDTLGFFLLPFVYLFSFIRGCVRFRSFGAIL